MGSEYGTKLEVGGNDGAGMVGYELLFGVLGMSIVLLYTVLSVSFVLARWGG